MIFHHQSIVCLLVLMLGTLVSGRVSSSHPRTRRRRLQEDDSSSWTDSFTDFFTDERCLRTEKNTENLEDLSNWMSKLSNANNSTRLVDLTLPGTHNSVAFDLETDLNPNDPDYSTVEEGTFNIPDDVIAQWICGYALTQSLSLSEQLQAGARYLDLRFDYDTVTSAWRGYHFLFGLKMTPLLEQIASFAKEHPKEIIVLEFGTIYSAATAEQKQNYRSKITNVFAGNLIPTTVDLATVTLAELQEAGTNIMAVVRDDEVASGTDVLWSDAVIENTFAETDDIAALEAFNEQKLTEFYARTTEDSLYKIQWILTPSTQYIQENPLVGNLYELAKEGNAKLSNFKRPASAANKLLGNILSVDYIEISPLLEILELEQYTSGSFVPEPVDPQSQWTAGAKIGLGVGCALFLCGLCCLCKFCKGRKK